jgi:hypothetical protein
VELLSPGPSRQLDVEVVGGGGLQSLDLGAALLQLHLLLLPPIERVFNLAFRPVSHLELVALVHQAITKLW